MNLSHGPLKKKKIAALYEWVHSIANFVIYPPNILPNQKSTAWESILLRIHSFITM